MRPRRGRGSQCDARGSLLSARGACPCRLRSCVWTSGLLGCFVCVGFVVSVWSTFWEGSAHQVAGTNQVARPHEAPLAWRGGLAAVGPGHLVNPPYSPKSHHTHTALITDKICFARCTSPAAHSLHMLRAHAETQLHQLQCCRFSYGGTAAFLRRC